MTVHHLRSGTIHVGDWMQADLTPGYTLAIVDGPYGMGKADWDRMKIDDLAAWYEPHIARLSALLAPSASVYLWNTAEGWARIDPVMRAAGWTFRSLIVWDKQRSIAIVNPAVGFAEVIEVAALYLRGGARPQKVDGAPTNVWRTDLTSTDREKLKGDAVVRSTTVSTNALHPCQKPLAFADRMIRASTRPGERVLVPFGGTCREAVVCEWLARTEPAEARWCDTCEINVDGVDYIGPVLAQLRGEDPRPRAAGQVGLFGMAP